MKTDIYTNCSLVRVPIKAGVSEYSFPQNVDWAERVVNRIAVCCPQAAVNDPVDGVTPVLSASDVKDLFFTLYDDKNNEIMHDVSYEQILHLNNAPLRIDAKLNLSLCRLAFTSAPAQDYTLLLYVFFQTRTEDYFDAPRKNVSVTFDLDADEQISLQEIINTYVHALPARIKGMIFWNAETDPSWITLRDYQQTYRMTNIHSEMARPDMQGAIAQANVFWLNDLDIDFDNSYIRNAQSSQNTQKITFFF